MPSTAQRAALARAAARLPVEDRNLLTQHGRLGISAVMDFLRVDKRQAQAELQRVRDKLAPLVQQELRQAPAASNGASSLGPPDRPPAPLEGPQLRSRGELKPDTPARKRKAATYKEKACGGCGKNFKPRGPRQTHCPDCGGPPAIEEPTAPAPSSTEVKAAALDVAGVEPAPAVRPPSRAPAPRRMPREYMTLRGELSEIAARLNSFATRLDRVMEKYTNPEQNGGHDGGST